MPRQRPQEQPTREREKKGGGGVGGINGNPDVVDSIVLLPASAKRHVWYGFFAATSIMYHRPSLIELLGYNSRIKDNYSTIDVLEHM